MMGLDLTNTALATLPVIERMEAIGNRDPHMVARRIALLLVQLLQPCTTQPRYLQEVSRGIPGRI